MEEINQTISSISNNIKQLREKAKQYVANTPERGQIAAQIEELMKERGRAYSKRNTLDAEKRAAQNARAKAYYQANREKIAIANRDRYNAKQKKELEENGAYKSPDDPNDIVFDKLTLN